MSQDPIDDWLQFCYDHPNISNGDQVERPGYNQTTFIDQVSHDHSTMDTAIATTAAITSATGSSSISLKPEGGVAKPPISTTRPTRSSRRTPTTLLNTDTTNFRAMVRRYTVGTSNPSMPFASVAGPSGFTLTSARPRRAPPVRMNYLAQMTTMAGPPDYGYYQRQCYSFPQQNQQQQHLIFPMNNNNVVQRPSNMRLSNRLVWTDQGTFSSNSQAASNSRVSSYNYIFNESTSGGDSFIF